IWLGTQDNGLAVIHPDGKSFSNFRYSANDINTLSNNRIHSISVDNTGNLWIGTDDGLNIFDPVTTKASRVTGDRRNKYSFIGKSVRSIYIGKDGIFW